MVIISINKVREIIDIVPVTTHLPDSILQELRSILTGKSMEEQEIRLALLNSGRFLQSAGIQVENLLDSLF